MKGPEFCTTCPDHVNRQCQDIARFRDLGRVKTLLNKEDRISRKLTEMDIEAPTRNFFLCLLNRVRAGLSVLHPNPSRQDLNTTSIYTGTISQGVETGRWK